MNLGTDSGRDQAIVIVTGVPRSGTSLLMQMLAAAGLPTLTDGVRRADEDNPRGYFEYEPVKRTRQDDQWLQQAAGRAVKLVHQLLYDLPTDRPYKILVTRRNMREVLASQSVMLVRRGVSGAALAPDRLGRAFQRQLRDLKEYMDQHPCFEWLEVRYNEILADPHVQAERISRFLGDRLDPSRMASAVDPTLHRQRG